MDATTVATAGVQPGELTRRTRVTGQLEKLHRLHQLKAQLRELTHELDSLTRELFGYPPQ